MIPFPTDSYMRALAEAIYAVAYLEGLIRFDLYRLDPPANGLDAWSTSRDTLGEFAHKIECEAQRQTKEKKKMWLEACASALKEVYPMRNQVLHSAPATIQGAQMLNRWTGTTSTKKQEALPITEEFLTGLRDIAFKHVKIVNDVRLSDPDVPRALQDT